MSCLGYCDECGEYDRLVRCYKNILIDGPILLCSECEVEFDDLMMKVLTKKENEVEENI